MVSVGFEAVLAEEMGSKGFGTQRWLATGKERPHISKSKLARRDDTEFVNTGEAKTLVYRDWMGRRYLAAEGVSYDFVVTLYDVNSPRAWAARFFDAKELEKALRQGSGR